MTVGLYTCESPDGWTPVCPISWQILLAAVLLLYDSKGLIFSLGPMFNVKLLSHWSALFLKLHQRYS